MGKTKDGAKDRPSKEKTSKLKAAPSLTASEKAIDPTLASLFGSSLGPVRAPARTYRPFTAAKSQEAEDNDSTIVDGESDTGTSDAEKFAVRSSKEGKKEPMISITPPKADRKSKRKRENDDLEDEYMKKLQEEEEKEHKRREQARVAKKKALEESKLEKNLIQEEASDEETSDDGTEKVTAEDGTAENEETEDEDIEDEDEEDEEDESGDSEGEKTKSKSKEDKKGTELPIRHEALERKGQEDLEKSARTIFLGNVPSSVISSKHNYKILKSVFSGPGNIDSIRFRSIAFSEQIPRKAAFITHKLHEKQQTVNAYIVYKTKEAAREALKLNGTVILDRHIRVDSVAHPANHDATTCVFIGNLDFEAQEESLWQHFASCGKIESVRIVRDAATNVGKGFAYVQFEDGTSVEQALFLDGKQMEGGRKLRVSRAKNIKRKNKNIESRAPLAKKQKVYNAKEDPRQREMLGRANKLLGKAGAAKMKKVPEAFVIEGVRATSSTNPGVKLGHKGGKARARATARSSAWKQKAKAKK